jgi:hypothetical protein
MLPETTRNAVSFLAICSLLFVTTKSTSRLFFYPLAHVNDVNHDSRLHKLLDSVIISQGGVVPFIQPELLPVKSKSKKDAASQEV